MFYRAYSGQGSPRTACLHTFPDCGKPVDDAGQARGPRLATV